MLELQDWQREYREDKRETKIRAYSIKNRFDLFLVEYLFERLGTKSEKRFIVNRRYAKCISSGK